MVRRHRPPSQTWRTFLTNHLHHIAAADFCVVPTATCRLLFVLVILGMSAAGLSTSRSPIIPPPLGRPNSSVKRSHGMRRRAIWCTTVIRPFTHGRTRCRPSALRTSSWLFAHPGQTPMRSDSSDRFAANASITSSLVTSAAYDASCARTWSTTCASEHTSRSTKTHRSRDRWRQRPMAAPSWRFRSSVVCTIATNVARLSDRGVGPVGVRLAGQTPMNSICLMSYFSSIAQRSAPSRVRVHTPDDALGSLRNVAHGLFSRDSDAVAT